MNPTDQINIRQRAKEILDRLPPAEIIKGLERIERSYWRTLCDVFERLTGESLDDADSQKQYLYYASLVKLWGEAYATWKRSDPEDEEPQLCVPLLQSDLRKIERRAWHTADEFLDTIAHECWSRDAEPETKKYLAVIAAVDDWAIALCELRTAQGDDGIRWGRNVVQFETVKAKRFRRERP